MSLLTSSDVVQFIRDQAELNILLDETMFTTAEINAAISLVIDQFNLFTPISNWAEDNFPNRYLLLIGVAAHLMQSEAFLQLRNQATYQDGDVQNIGIDDKFQLYMQLSKTLKAEFREDGKKLKQQQNMENGYGSLASGYRFVRTGIRNL
jgi:hypothetical protein